MTLRLVAASAACAAFALLWSGPASAQNTAAPSNPASPQSPVSAAAIPAEISLADAQNIAVASSPALALARATVDQASAGVGVASSGEVPNVSAQASSSRLKGQTRTTGGTSGGGGVTSSGQGIFTFNSGAVNLRQLVLDGGRVRSQVEAAKFGTDAARLTLRRQVQSVLFGVAQGYYATLEARHLLETAREAQRLAKVQEQLVEAQFRAGVASKADVLTAQLPVAQAELSVAQAANSERSQLASLLATMGLSAQTSVSLKEDDVFLPALPPLEDILDRARRERSDLLAAQASVRAAQESVRAARLGRFPVLNATASDGPSSTSASGGNYVNTYSFGLSLSFPILDGGLVKAQAAQAQAQADTATANLRNAELNLSQTVQQAYLGLQTAQAGVTAANAELSQARTVLDVTNAQFKAGVTTLPLLLNAQVNLTKAQSDHVNAIYTYKTAQQQLLFAEGIIGM